jgi:hypothetical protein
MTVSDTAATRNEPDHQKRRSRPVPSPATSGYYHSAQCRKCWQPITREPGGPWVHSLNRSARCAPDTVNASLAESITRTEKLHPR